MIGGEKFLASREGAAEGGVGGEFPPRPSVPPERSGGGQFRSKNVRAELYNSTIKKSRILRDFLFGNGLKELFTARLRLMCSPLFCIESGIGGCDLGLLF